MRQNIHSIERVIRIIIGLVLVSQAFLGLQNMWFLFGVVPLLTGVIGWCPPYAVFGINTCTFSSCGVKGKSSDRG